MVELKPVAARNKTDITDLADMPREEFSFGGDLSSAATVYHFNEDGFRYDFVLNPSANNTDRLFVFFSGDAMRSRYQIPVFQRWRWADRFPGHTMFISDPTLYEHESLNLAWYLGTDRTDPMPVIARLVASVAEKLGVPLSRVFAYGSSGGGFAALRLSLFLPPIGVVTINPQIDVTKYHTGAPRRLLELCFSGLTLDGALQKYPERFDLNTQADTLKERRILYIQNLADPHHLSLHFGPFATRIGLSHTEDSRKGGIQTLFFSDPRGHTAPEPPEMVEKVLDIIQRSGDDGWVDDPAGQTARP